MSAGVEVWGLLLEHAFMRLNLERVEDGTHENLKGFIDMLSVVGVRIEGISKNFFLRDGKWSSKVNFSALKEDFINLKSQRGGKILFNELSELKKEIVNAVKANKE